MKWEAVWLHQDEESSAWGAGDSADSAARDAIRVGMELMPIDDAEGFTDVITCYGDPVWVEEGAGARLTSWSDHDVLEVYGWPRPDVRRVK